MKNIFAIAIFIGFSLNSLAQQLNLEQANRLASLPLKCLQQEYPNKLGQLLQDSTEIASPKALHPSFYGCFDWHSSVHGHWSLVYLVKRFPNLKNRSEIIQKLQTNLSKENIAQEVAYLSKKHEKSFERLYGWAWVLKLQQELSDFNEPFAQDLARNLQPLSDLLVERYSEFLPKLYYPVRVGTHTNTAFGMTLAWDYAVCSKNESFKKILKENALRMFQNDVDCPFAWEPSGTDFLSPCMEEMGIMQRVLNEQEFLKWSRKFAKSLFDKNFAWKTAVVSDRTDGHLVHLDGLNFSRAWHFYALAKQFDKFRHLQSVGNIHFNQSLPSLVDGNYEGEHWLASFALRAFEQKGF
ncbi:DUF2891 domain-containing protein [Flavobacterium sp.]|uniref:DUF2891 domain-containing protein n=1 Tax=Flavobacterium sp. TaxID=239 RepID=UPI0028BDEE95|nr:DUF2891 domain-containing protein [Flavobacterium sp.]